MNLWEIFIIAIGLSMDTFSLSLAISLSNLFKKNKVLSIIVGLYHFFMPLLGFIIGKRLYFLIHFNYDHLLGIILLLIALNIILDNSKDNLVRDTILGLNIFAFTVSIDAFSVGIGLEKISFLYSFIFATVSLIFTYIGLKFGKLLSQKLKKLPKLAGIILLIFIGVYNLFK